MMDKTTHQVRSANWKSLIEQCQARPEGQTAKQWLADNNVCFLQVPFAESCKTVL